MIEYDKSSPYGRASLQAAKARKTKKAPTGALLCEKVHLRKYLTIGSMYFRCPYCPKQWERGGHKEGFLKAAATRHAYGCYEIALFKAGYIQGDWTSKGQIAEVFDAKNEYHAKVARSIKNAIARRRREYDINGSGRKP